MVRRAAPGLLIAASLAAPLAAQEGGAKKAPAELVKARVEAFLKGLSPSKLRCSKVKKQAHDCDSCQHGVRNAPLEKHLGAFLHPDLAPRAFACCPLWAPMERRAYPTWRPGLIRQPVIVEEFKLRDVAPLRDRWAVYITPTGQHDNDGSTQTCEDMLVWVVVGDQAWLDTSWIRRGDPATESPFFLESDSVAGFFGRIVELDVAISGAGTTVAKEDATARKQAYEDAAVIADRGWVNDVQQTKDKAGNPIPDLYWVVVWSGPTRVNVQCKGKREEFSALKKWDRLLLRGKFDSLDCMDRYRPEPLETNWTLTLREGSVRKLEE